MEMGRTQGGALGLEMHMCLVPQVCFFSLVFFSTNDHLQVYYTYDNDTNITPSLPPITCTAATRMNGHLP